MAQGQMRDVLLGEGADPDGAPDGAPDGGGDGRGDGGTGPRDRTPARRRSWPLVVGLVVLLAAGSVVSGARARDRVARVAGLPGVLAPLGPSLRELWRVAPGWGQLATIGGDVLLGRVDDRGMDVIVSIDQATGEERWSAPVPELTESGGLWCETLGDAARHQTTHVVCRVVHEARFDPESGSYRPYGLALLIVLDAGTGERVVERTMESAFPTLVSLGRDVVWTEVLPDGHARVTREDPVSGERRWTFRSPRPVHDPNDDPTGELVPDVQHGVILATGAAAWAFAPDGTVLGEWQADRGRSAGRDGGRVDVAVLPDGRFAVGEAGGSGSGGSGRDRYGTVSTTDARDGFRIPGRVLQPDVDDGSVADVLFTLVADHSGLVALDAATGERLWESDSGPGGDAIVLDGRLIAMAGQRLAAIDARSGRELWSADVRTGNPFQQVLTDGRVVVVSTVGERGDVLIAFDPADGRERWRAPLPAGVLSLRVVGGRLLALTDGDLIALG